MLRWYLTKIENFLYLWKFTCLCLYQKYFSFSFRFYQTIENTKFSYSIANVSMLINEQWKTKGRTKENGLLANPLTFISLSDPFRFIPWPITTKHESLTATYDFRKATFNSLLIRVSFLCSEHSLAHTLTALLKLATLAKLSIFDGFGFMFVVKSLLYTYFSSFFLMKLYALK